MPTGDKHAKTEKPTPKRRKEFRERGQVARSPDVSSWAGMLIASFLLPWYLNMAKSNILALMTRVRDVISAPNTQSAVSVLGDGLRTVLVTVLPLAATMAVSSAVLNLAQTGAMFSFKAARPRLDRVSPKSGIRRLFSASTLQQLAKQVLKIVALGGIGYSLLANLTRSMVTTSPVSLLPVLGAEASTVLTFVHVLALLGLLVGAGDFALQKRRLNQQLRMTKDEVRDENKAMEGDPHVKAMVKKRMYQLSRSRVLAGVRKADVIVTNPTHYAVALQYDATRGLAPRVVAKGSDLLAQRIRAEAATWSVPVVEDPPLARYLYAVCDLEQQIPSEIYLAVAKLLAFIYSLPTTVRAAAVHHPAPSIVPTEPEALSAMTDSQRARVLSVLAGVAR